MGVGLTTPLNVVAMIVLVIILVWDKHYGCGSSNTLKCSSNGNSSPHNLVWDKHDGCGSSNTLKCSSNVVKKTT